ncbi:MAG TPA: serine/threonine-protein kinase [Gemmatales bacterium]|nr:serine/threonine-protein kinase [Gemmatales bacterium]
MPLPQVPGFEVRAEVGRGGMGVVYQAVDLKRRRPVAVKVVLAGQFLGAQEVARFQVEAEMMARLRHPHVIQVYEFGWVDGRPYLIMEWAEGGTFAAWLHHYRLTPAGAAAVVADLAEAVQAAHIQGVIHRDLKPGNVLLTGWRPSTTPPAARQTCPSLPSGAVAKITDFGLAKELNPTGAPATRNGLVVGTPHYMAPEQATGQTHAIGPSADLYALGAILYELLTGRPPLADLAPLDFLMQIQLRDPAPPRRLRPEVPRDLESICQKCLEKDPDRRYPSAADLAADLHRFLAGEPVVARPIGRWSRLGKWVRRRPAVAALAGTLGVVVIGSLLALSNLWRHAEAQRHLAEREREEARVAQHQAEAVTRFLVHDLLGQGLPDRAQDRNITFEEVVVRAARRLGPAFRDQPLVEAEVRRIVGQLLRAMSRDDEALEHWERSAALRQRWLGPTDPATIAAETDLARLRAALSQRGSDVGKHRADLEARVAELRRVLGPEHLETTHVENELASLLVQQGEAAAADRLLRRLEQRGRKVHGINHPTTLGILNNYGHFLYTQGRFTEAEQMLREALQGMKAHLGDQHSMTTTCINNLALVLQALGRAAEAEPLFRETLAARRQMYGPDHPDTLAARHNLAGTLHKQERWAECEAEYQAALAARRQVLGPEHPHTITTAYNFAQALFAQRKHDEALPLLHEVYRVRRRDLGLTHADTRHVLANLVKELMNKRRFAEAEPLAALLAERGSTGEDQAELLDHVFLHGYCLARLARHSEAEAVLERCAAGRADLLGPTHPDTTSALNELAASQAHQGKFDAAVANLEECVRRRRQQLGPKHEQTLATEISLAALLANAKRFEEAEQRLLGAAAAWGDDADVPTAVRRRLFISLVRTYEVWGRPEAGQPWKAKADSLGPNR